MRNAPAVDSTGRLFLHTRERLFALREEDGRAKVLWEYVTGSRAPGPVVVSPDDTVRLHCTDGYLHSIEASSGRQTWPPACVGEPLGYAVPAVDLVGNTWISAAEGGLLKVDSGGTVEKPAYFRSRQKFDSPGVIAHGVLYVAAEGGYVFAIDLTEERGTNQWNHAAEHGFAGGVHAAPAMTADGLLIVAGQDEHLYGFAPTGALNWRTQLPGQILGSPVFDRYGHIYIGVSQAPRGVEPRGLLVCLDGNSHKLRWEYRAAGPVESTPVIGDDDIIYFGDNAGVIHAVSFHGRAQWTAEVGSPVRSAGTILAPQRLAFGLDNETLLVLECSSKGLAKEGWPKIGRNGGQNGLA